MNYEIIIKILTDKIEELESDLLLKNWKIGELEKEIEETKKTEVK